MGVLVFIMAILPQDTGRNMHIMRAEMPGPIVGKLVPKIKSTAKILYLIYICLTLLMVVFLYCGDMSLYESFVHAFGAAGTGGFGIKADSIASYSPYIQWVITIFMLIFGVNFNLYYLILMKKIVNVIKSEELWTYIIIVLASIGVVTYNVYPMYNNLSETIRHSAFQVSSIITSTGYSTVDYTLWPSLSQSIIFILMFIGACAGSTGGGIKVSRIVILLKSVKREINKLVHPNSVSHITFEGQVLDENIVRGVNNYFGIFICSVVAAFILLSFNGLDFETTFSSIIACVNNIGPGFSLVGPMGNFSCYNDFSKIVLSCLMLIGRLEIYPILLLFVPKVWLGR
jgi:trk system potassium uptake protein TrkH